MQDTTPIPVNGNAKEDMSHMRNGTGLRNCTISGLSGALGSANHMGLNVLMLVHL